eukprot:scaffold503_cov375-Pinguiococcus_pyrenoidosus.AAC.9
MIPEQIEKMGASWIFGEPSPQIGNVPPEERIGLIQKAPARVSLFPLASRGIKSALSETSSPFRIPDLSRREE